MDLTPDVPDDIRNRYPEEFTPRAQPITDEKVASLHKPYFKVDPKDHSDETFLKMNPELEHHARAVLKQYCDARAEWIENWLKFEVSKATGIELSTMTPEEGAQAMKDAGLRLVRIHPPNRKGVCELGAETIQLLRNNVEVARVVIAGRERAE